MRGTARAGAPSVVERQFSDPARQVGAAVQEIDDDHRLVPFDEYDQMHAAADEVQGFVEGRVDQAPAGADRAVPAAIPLQQAISSAS